MSDIPLSRDELGALVGGLLGAVDFLMYWHHRPQGDAVANEHGVDPDDEVVVRAVADLAVTSTNGHVDRPGQSYMKATSEERVERLVRGIMRQRENPPRRPPLKVVP